jgi:hypothetical protein
VYYPSRQLGQSIVAGWIPALKGVFHSQSGEVPTQHIFRVRRDPGVIGRGDRADHIYGYRPTAHNAANSSKVRLLSKFPAPTGKGLMSLTHGHAPPQLVEEVFEEHYLLLLLWVLPRIPRGDRQGDAL